MSLNYVKRPSRDKWIPRIYEIYIERLKIYEEAFREFVEALCRSDKIIDAFLVGSRARGDNLPYSDYDIVVVVPSNIDKLSVAEELRRLRKKSFPLDLIPLYKDELNDPIYSEMLRYARKLCKNR
ncbi:MAG: nucleotidyltransferase domain-containing protein [Desulfurococcus sp.]|uniref:nucleotidyltransferase domain-containing protein n=1 Tax=Desulfurococcus sp. TaxID=51678 RepID=UPI00315F8B65